MALRLVSTSARGRALVAARPFVAGERVFKERPLFYADPTAPTAAASPALADRLFARLPLAPLRAACEEEGVRYPLLVAQMIVHSLVDKSADAEASTFDVFWGAVAQLQTHVPDPPPPRWAAQYGLLRAAFCAPEARIRGADQLFASGALDQAWFACTLGALHANLVRTSPTHVALLSIGSMLNHDCAPNLDFAFFEDAPAAAAAGSPSAMATSAGASAPSRAFGALGVAELCARTDIAEGDELTITYVSPLAPAAARPDGASPLGVPAGRERGVPSAAQREQLRLAHGFDCDSCACASRQAGNTTS